MTQNGRNRQTGLCGAAALLGADGQSSLTTWGVAGAG